MEILETIEKVKSKAIMMLATSSKENRDAAAKAVAAAMKAASDAKDSANKAKAKALKEHTEAQNRERAALKHLADLKKAKSSPDTLKSLIASLEKTSTKSDTVAKLKVANSFPALQSLLKSAEKRKSDALETFANSALTLKNASKKVAESIAKEGKSILKASTPKTSKVVPSAAVKALTSKEAYLIANNDAIAAKIAAENAEKATFVALQKAIAFKKAAKEIQIKKKSSPAFLKVFFRFLFLVILVIGS